MLSIPSHASCCMKVPLADVFNHKPSVVALGGEYVVAEEAGEQGIICVLIDQLDVCK